MSDEIHLLDVVALQEALPDRNLFRDQVGTVVEVLGDGVFEIEFCDGEGRTYATAAVPAHCLLPLRYRPAGALK